MESKEHNALVELAERLMHHLEVANAVAGFDQQVWGDIRKAQHIIAELAKVRGDFVKAKPNSKAVDMWLANKFDIISAFNNCRAIAEEG